MAVARITYGCDEPEGYQLILGTGAISTLDYDDTVVVWDKEFEFGFQPPAPPPFPTDLPNLTSSAWADWLDG